MDKQDELYINEQIIEFQQMYLQKIKNRVKELFKQAVDEKVYKYYTPNTYERTYQMLENIDVKIGTDDNLYVYVDNQFYYSAVDGSPQYPNFINYIIQEGHSDGKGTNQYHDYEGRDYLGYAKELIDKEFDCDCEIISDEP